jgi:hypothetical protein
MWSNCNARASENPHLKHFPPYSDIAKSLNLFLLSLTFELLYLLLKELGADVVTAELPEGKEATSAPKIEFSTVTIKI